MSNQKYYDYAKDEAGKTKVTQAKETEVIYEAVKQFERDNIAIIKGKAKFLLRLCIGEFVVIALLAGAITVMSPLKTVIPFAIRVDNNTGYTDIAPTLSDAKETYGEAESKYFLAKYVINYESYDWQTIKEQVRTVELMSDAKVAGAFNAAVRAPNSPLNILKDQYKIKLTIKPVVPLQKDIAQVRFTKTIVDNNGVKAPGFLETNWIATISYDFNNQKKIKTEADRRVNPLEMRVVSYRVDAEAAQTTGAK